MLLWRSCTTTTRIRTSLSSSARVLYSLTFTLNVEFVLYQTVFSDYIAVSRTKLPYLYRKPTIPTRPSKTRTGSQGSGINALLTASPLMQLKSYLLCVYAWSVGVDAYFMMLAYRAFREVEVRSEDIHFPGGGTYGHLTISSLMLSNPYWLYKVHVIAVLMFKSWC